MHKFHTLRIQCSSKRVQERLSLGVFNLRDVLSELFDAKRRDVFPKEIQIFCHIDSGVPSGLIVDGTRLYK